MLVNVLLIGSILTIAAYLGWISYLILGQSPVIHHSHQKPKSISIIICCRNDQKELIHLTNAIQQQILPHQQVELIVVDDHSDEPIEMPNNRFNQLLTLSASDGEGKKAALAKGIAHAKNEWIVTLDADVLIKEIPSKKVAVIKYSGSLSEQGIEEKSEELKNWLLKKGFKPISNSRSAAYDPPWTLPFLRRNEVHIDIE